MWTFGVIQEEFFLPLSTNSLRRVSASDRVIVEVLHTQSIAVFKYSMRQALGLRGYPVKTSLLVNKYVVIITANKSWIEDTML